MKTVIWVFFLRFYLLSKVSDSFKTYIKRDREIAKKDEERKKRNTEHIKKQE